MHESESRASVHAFEHRGNVSAAPLSSWSQKYSVSPSFCPAQWGAPALCPTALCVPLITVTDE